MISLLRAVLPARRRSDDSERSLALLDRIVGENGARDVRHSAPSCRFLIFFTARSGSTWLTEVLAGNGGLGRPGEFFNPNRIGRQCKRFGINSLAEYPFLIQRYRKDTTSGVFGAEVTWQQYTFLLPKVDLLQAFPSESTAFFTLRRENLVLQAISTYKAEKTGVFGPNTNSENRTAEDLDVGLVYNPAALKLHMKSIVSQELQIDRHLASLDIRPLRLTYERMMKAGPSRVSDLICQALPVSVKVAQESTPPVRRKLATPMSDEWAARFSRDHKRFLQKLERKRNLVSDI